ncbi:ECF transporter S component [Allofustis seminis]|uniref:ECF transporter S component n=1 Tax=Allofustis seminis TaxID=166939 RepID=UPI0003782158|nr:ECF transporter S component [Allofustis seminis]
MTQTNSQMKKTKNTETFSMMVILLIPIAIAINVVGAQLTSLLKLPVDLDMIGVILVGALAGPIPAALAGLLTNLVNGVLDPTWLPYIPVAMCIGIAAGLLAKYNMMNTFWKICVSGLVIAIVATVTATPVTVFAFGGITGGASSVFITGLMASGKKIVESVLSVYIFTETIGKLISVLVAYLIIRVIPTRTVTKYKYGMNYISKN